MHLDLTSNRTDGENNTLNRNCLGYGFTIPKLDYYEPEKLCEKTVKALHVIDRFFIE